ncbi:MAG: dihydroorotase [Leucothrix sp.]
MSTLLICNVQIVNEGLIQEADVFIRNGRIARIEADLSHLVAKQVIDGAGKHLIPGVIDTECRLHQCSDALAGWEQESKAAIVGGITSSLIIPSASPDNSVSALCLDRANTSFNNFAVYHRARHRDLAEIEGLNPFDCCGVYVDMASEQDEFRIDDPEILSEMLGVSPVIVAVHAEDAPSILENEESYRQIYGDDVPFYLHSSVRSAQACYIAASQILEIAVKTGARAHLLHVSSVKEIELLKRLRKQSSMISAGVCSHYLTFSDADYADREGLLKCEPSIKTDIDRAALLQGLLDNNIDVISSGHTPIKLPEKQGQYFSTSSGLPLAQYTVPAILEHYQDQIVSLECIVEKTSHAVAERFAIKDRGYIREGYWADLVLVDVEDSFIARDEDVVSSAGWTVFNGKEFRSSVVKTIVNGHVVWSDEVFSYPESVGVPLTFHKC